MKIKTKNILLLAVFFVGACFGAVASEIAKNGLFVFRAGDPILASEVNANFDLILKRIEVLESTLGINSIEKTIVGVWDCTGDSPSTIYIVFRADGIYSEIGEYVIYPLSRNMGKVR
ncbi:MAG: hypothetical protein IPK77_11755 [Cellvibrio sp.]|nr:hypothetical protein [Cellvibrio sp.]